MDRRSFVKSTSLLGLTTVSDSLVFTRELKPIVKPSALPKKPTVGLVAPASALSRSAFERALQNMEELGFEIKYSDNLRTRSGFLSGTDQQRLQDLHDYFADSDIDGIICARGGYGTGRLLEGLDYQLIKNNPKPLIGYSDITALLLGIYSQTGIVGFHGPVGASDMNDFTVDYLQDIVVKGRKVKIEAEKAETISGGIGEGRLIGGNLSLLVSLVGTPHDPDYKDHILFIEEVGESTYRVDRMLTQLRSAGKLDGVGGIALGYFTDCDTSPDDPFYEYSIGLQEVFHDRLGDMDIPVCYGFPFGHEKHNATLPVGVKAVLDANKGVLKTIESAVL
ncbi:MAG: LD-carboxypeptidase [Cyclobacteriaceae bacterium]|nr:LD-carboxypeptidase [Cyclobacteriaceae bacterium HetDA_MAG_MS6]